MFNLYLGLLAELATELLSYTTEETKSNIDFEIQIHSIMEG